MFTYTDSEVRTYPDLLDADGNVLVAVPNVTTLDTDPGDGRWTAQATQTAPEAPVAPAEPTTDPTTPTN
jgi:hypothetical protein